MLIIEGSKGGVAALVEEMADTHEGRMQQMFSVGVEVGKDGQIGELDQVFFISEGWMSAASGEKPPKIPPSQDPERKEVLIVTQSKIAEDETRMKVFEMIRDRQGILTDLKDFEPGAIKETTAKDAFQVGFRMGKSSKLN